MLYNAIKEKLQSDRAVVWASQLLNALLSVVLGKMIAVNFATNEFGRYSLIISSLFLYSSLFLNPVLQFFAVKLGDRDEQQVVDAFIWGILGFNLVFFVFPLIISLNIPEVTHWDRLLLFLLVVGQSWISLFLNEANMSRRYWLNSIALLLPQIINILFVLAASIMGWGGSLILLLAVAAANIFTALFFLLRRYYFENYSIDIESGLRKFKSYLFSVVRFSLPLVMLALVNWLVSYGDRYLIAYFMSAADVGLYAANYGLASKVLLLITGPALTLLRPGVYDQGISVVDKKKYVVKSIFRHSSVAAFFVMMFGLFYHPLGTILLSADYEAGFKLMVPIALAYALLTSTQFFDLFFYGVSKTSYILIVYGTGVFVNIGLNICLIPEWGLEGAGYANVLGCLFQFIIAAILFRQVD